MKQSIYLHDNIVDILHCYGTLEDVINRILSEAAEGNFDVMNKPACPDRTGAGRYDIEILESSYLELYSLYGPFSSKISLRRLIYWFVDNEIYEELGWEPVKRFESKRKKICLAKLTNATNELFKVNRYATAHIKDAISEVCDRIKEIQEMIIDE